MENTIKAVCIDFEEDVPKKNKKQEEYVTNVFTMQLENGITEIEMSNDDYIESFLDKVGFDSLGDYADELIDNETEVDLYLIDNGNFVGYSFTEGFSKNYFPHQMGMKVEIIAVEDNGTSVTLKLADDTVARRNFSTLRIDPKTKEEDWFFDPVKQMRFIKKELGFEIAGFTFDQLVGRVINYSIDSSFGDDSKQFLKVKKVFPVGTKALNMNDDDDDDVED